MLNCESFAFTFLCLRPSFPNPNGFYIAGLSISLLVTLSKLVSPIIKTQYQSKFICSYGGGGGIRIPVQNPFLSTSYSLNLQYIFILICCQVNLVLSTRIELVSIHYQCIVLPLYYESVIKTIGSCLPIVILSLIYFAISSQGKMSCQC